MTLGWVWWRTWGPLVARDAGALLRGRRGTFGTGLGLVVRLGPFGRAQAWHLVTSTFVLRGRRGTCGNGLGLVARLGPLARA